METIQETQTIVTVSDEPEFIANTNENVSANFIILCEDSLNSSLDKNIFEYEIAGVSVLNWVARACLSQPMVIRSVGDVLTLVKPYAKGADYTVVLYANTPLINKQHLKDLLAFIERRHIYSCKLKKGYIFKNEYISRVDDIYGTITYDFAGDDFFEVNNLEDLAFASKILNSKVLGFFKDKGVLFENENTVFAHANTEIDFGSKVSSGVSVLNKSKIGTNCEISSNVVIDGSKVADYVEIGAGAKVLNSVVKSGAKIASGVCIKDSIVGQNVIVGVNSALVSSAVKDNSVVGDNCFVKSSMIKENTFICDAVSLINARVAENAKIGPKSSLIGDEDPVIIYAGQEISSNSILTPAIDEFHEAGE